MKKIIFSNEAPAPIGPYSQAVEANGFLFISGQIAIQQSNGKLIIDSIENETLQVMKNLQHILSSRSLDWSHVIKTTIFLKNMDDFVMVNTVYGTFFSENPPARETVEVSRLPKNVNVEISCVAVAK